MGPNLSLGALTVSGFRNLADARLDFAPGVNVLVGDNGQGKTSVLEAIYFAATTRSFRTSRAEEMRKHGTDVAVVRGFFDERRAGLSSLRREQLVSCQRKRVLAKVDDNRPKNLGSFAALSPVVVFHPEELALSTGSASLRRKLLDRVAFYSSPSHAGATATYAKALRARQELLKAPGSPDGEIAAYESILAEAGARITAGRALATRELLLDVTPAFARIAAPGLTIGFAYRLGGSEDPEAARAALAERRTRDRFAKAATFGPHRDELVIDLDGHPARAVASQGQHRAITLSLKAAECASVARLTRLTPVQLFDDISSELDPDRTRALFSFLVEMRGQIFLTTTQPSLAELGLAEASENARFRVEKGVVAR